MDNRLTKKVAVITGSGSGIGQSIALRFAEEQAFVAILEMNASGAEDTLRQITASGGKGGVYECDVSQQNTVKQVMGQVVEKHGKIDILVNNAGIAHVGNVENTSEADLDRIYQVNIKGVYNCLQAAIGHMVKAGSGVILNLASIASKLGISDRFAYPHTRPTDSCIFDSGVENG